MDGRDELHALDGDGCDRALRALGSGDAPGDVHLAQHPATADMAVCVDVAGAGDDAEHRFSVAYGQGCSSSLNLFAASSCPLLALRKTRLIRAPASSTDRPAPSATAISM